METELGGGVWCVQRMSHDHHWLPLAELAISFFSRFLLALTASFTRVNPGSIHLRQLINSKQKSKTNFRVVLIPSCRAYILPYTPPVHITRLHIRTTYNNQQAQQTCLYEQWPHRCQPAVSLGSRTKIVLRSSLSRPVCRPRLSAWWLGATIVSAFHDWKFIPHLFCCLIRVKIKGARLRKFRRTKQTLYSHQLRKKNFVFSLFSVEYF